MSSRRGSETDQNPKGSIEARVALGAICELGSSSSEHLSPEHCDGAGMQRAGLLSMPVRRVGRADGNPQKRVRSSARFWPVGGHGIPVPIGHPSAAIAIPSPSVFDAPEFVQRFHISAGLTKDEVAR
jgi:hypothetical protein